MDVETFIAKIKDLSSRYKEWWYPSYKVFRAKYSKEHPNHDYHHYLKAFNEYESNLRNQSDLIGEIYDFLDHNYEVYLNASSEQQEEIRKTVTNAYYIDDKGSVSHFLEDLSLRYANERARPKLKETGDIVWLTRGLIAISLENSGIDSRDSIMALHELRKVANEKITDPKQEFARIARISSNEKPRGGSTPMSELMAG
jgi:hypothetical protein